MRWLLLLLLACYGCTPTSPTLDKQREEFQRIEKPLAPVPLPDPQPGKPTGSVAAATPAICDDPDPPKPALSKPAAVYIFTDTSWCAPCRIQKPHFEATRKITQKLGYRWVVPGDKGLGHVSYCTKVSTSRPPKYLDGRGIPCAVAVVDGRVVREWEVSDGNFSPEVLYYLIYGDDGKKARPIIGWELDRLKQAIAAHAAETDVRTRWWIAGMTPLYHLTHEPHNWPLSLVSQLDGEQMLWLHDADHRGVLTP